MSLIYSIDFRKGTLIDSVSGEAGTLTIGDGGFKNTEKGMALHCAGDTMLQSWDLGLWPTNGSLVVSCFKNPRRIMGGNDNQNILTTFDNGSTINSLRIENAEANNDELRVYMADATGYMARLIMSDFTPGKWYFIIFTWESGIMQIYNNTTSSDILTQTTSNWSFATRLPLTIPSFTIGRGFNTGRFWIGDISKVQFYNHSLTSQERSKLYQEFLHSKPIYPPKRNFITNKPKDLSYEDGLVAAYNMKPSAGGVLVDISGNGNNGTINGALATKNGMYFDYGTAGGFNDGNNISVADISLDSTTATVAFRAKNITANIAHMTVFDIGSIAAGSGGIKMLFSGGSTTTILFIVADNVSSRNVTTISIDDVDGMEFDMVLTADLNGNKEIWLNGISQGTVDISSLSGLMTGGAATIGGPDDLGGELLDLQVYNRLWSNTEIIAYHNSFAKETYIQDDFKNNPIG